MNMTEFSVNDQLPNNLAKLLSLKYKHQYSLSIQFLIFFPSLSQDDTLSYADTLNLFQLYSETSVSVA